MANIKPEVNQKQDWKTLEGGRAYHREALASIIYASLARECLMVDGSIDNPGTIATIQKAYALADVFLQTGQ